MVFINVMLTAIGLVLPLRHQIGLLVKTLLALAPTESKMEMRLALTPVVVAELLVLALAPTESKMEMRRQLIPVVVAELLVLALAPTESKMATKRELTPAVDVISAPALASKMATKRECRCGTWYWHLRRNQNETGIDTGGRCDIGTGTCSDGIKMATKRELTPVVVAELLVLALAPTESKMEMGLALIPVVVAGTVGTGTCSDGIKNGNETGIDTGGRCDIGTGTCSDGIKMATKRKLTPVVVAELLVLALAPTESKMATKRELTPAVDVISAPALAPTESKMATKRELTPVVVAELLVLALAPTESKMATKRELTPAVDVISAPALVPTESKMEMRLALIPVVRRMM